MHNKVFSKLDALENEYIEFLAGLCKIESPTEDKEAVDRAGGFIIRKAEDFGFSVTVKEEPKSGNPFVVTMGEDIEAKPLIFSAHVDTVHPKGLFGDDIVRIEDGIMYGPGVVDCKGGIAAALYAMAALKACGYNKRPLKLIVQTDEEVSSKFSEKRTVDFMYENSRGCAAFLNLEGHKPGYVTVERKGILRYDVEIIGVARHSSECYDGVSAVKEAAYKIIELEKMQQDGGITFNVGKIVGGTTANTVPEKCRFSLDIRFKNEADKAQAIKRAMDILSKQYLKNTETRVSLYSERVAMERSGTVLDVYRRLNKALELASFEPLLENSRAGGSDAADMATRGIPAVDSLGTAGGYIHSRNEYAYLSSLKNSAKMLAAAALYMEDPDEEANKG